MNLSFALSKTWHFTKALVHQTLILWPYRFLATSEENHWVIGGHRGRMYADNGAALHQWILENSSTKIFWVTKNKELFQNFQQKKIPVLWKNSLKARLLIWKAKVLLFSHGEDDLDSHILYWNTIPGKKIYLNHCLNLTKTGQMATRVYGQMNEKQKKQYRKSLTHFDYLLCSSEAERANFMKSFPAKPEQFLLGGGAHLDFFFQAKQKKAPTERLIVWFPTFRDLPTGQKTLNANIHALCTQKRLLEWLRKTKRSLAVCTHINSKVVTLPENSKDVIKVYSSEEIPHLLKTCELFISDYSGLIADYLILDKPFVAFPFDIDNYLAFRSFYSDYEDLTYGPVLHSVGELVETLCNDFPWDMELFTEKRNALKTRFFPFDKPVYAQHTYKTIQSILKKG